MTYGWARMAVAIVASVVVLMAMPVALGSTNGPASASPSHLAASTFAPTTSSETHTAPRPALTFPRTVLIETFTGVWCIHCPAESQALYYMDANASPSVLSIAELHACAFAPGSGPCLENYVPPDGTTDARSAFYGICGYPDVFFDGGHSACGASNSESQMQTEYQNAINNASTVPGNVSIAQTSFLSSGTVVLHANVTSGLNGSYNAVSYLMEYIGKRNQTEGYGPHDVGNVVRETLANHPISLTAGATTELNAVGPLNTTWNPLNLSVITFVQQNSTKDVENANFAPVTTLTAGIAAAPTTIAARNSTMLTVHVANSSTGLPLADATVFFNSSDGGTFTPSGGLTGSDGSFTANFTAPLVSQTTNIVVTAMVGAPGYRGASVVADVMVTPLVAPSVPQSLTVVPALQQVSLSWLPPASGGYGVSYNLFRSSSESGPYTAVNVTPSLQSVDASVSEGQAYWYMINAQGPGGLSANTTPVSASSVVASTQGLVSSVGWWLTIGTTTFSSLGPTSLGMFLGAGYYTYTYGPTSYAYVAVSPAGSLTVTPTSGTLNAVFQPRWAILQGTVDPAGASLTLDGTAVNVTDGSFLVLRVAGTYTLQAVKAGYQTKTSTVVLTPGNTTSTAVTLSSEPSGSSSQGTTLGGLSGVDLLAILGVVGVAILGTALFLSSRKGSGGRPPRSGGGAAPKTSGDESS